MTVEQLAEQDSASRFYNLLKSRMTGQVINGVLVGCLLESELKEIYEQYRQSINNSSKESINDSDS